MKKTLLMVLVALSGLTACGDQKITQQVTIDKSLLDALQGKATGTTTTPNTTASVSPSPPTGSSPTPTNGTSVGTSVGVSTDSKVVLKVIQDNADALNTENIGAYTDSLHPDSLFYKAMPSLFTKLVQGQLKYRINSSQVITHTTTQATVKVDRSTGSLGGVSHDLVLYTLLPSGSTWKIYTMELQGTVPSFDNSGSDDDFCFDQFGC